MVFRQSRWALREIQLIQRDRRQKMKTYKSIALSTILIFIILGIFTSAPAHAAGSSATKCNVWATSPSQSGSKLTSKGYASCANGTYLPYTQLCIIKKTWYGTKTIGCTSKDLMGGYLQPDNYSLTVSCDGKGKYFAELRWQELTLVDVAKYILNISKPSSMVWKIATGTFGTKFAVQAKTYDYCQ
jgi:hypothetical protein